MVVIEKNNMVFQEGKIPKPHLALQLSGLWCFS